MKTGAAISPNAREAFSGSILTTTDPSTIFASISGMPFCGAVIRLSTQPVRSDFEYCLRSSMSKRDRGFPVFYSGKRIHISIS